MFFGQDHGHPGMHLGDQFVGSPVMIEQVRSQSSADGSFQASHSPAKTKGESCIPIA
jgi:hypothetical protein